MLILNANSRTRTAREQNSCFFIFLYATIDLPLIREDNITEWTGLEFAKSLRAVENRGKWSKLVAKSAVVPKRPSWLRDRWEMRWNHRDNPVCTVNRAVHNVVKSEEHHDQLHSETDADWWKSYIFLACQNPNSWVILARYIFSVLTRKCVLKKVCDFLHNDLNSVLSCFPHKV